MEKGYPMILAFYIDRETITNGQVIKIFSDQVNKVLAEREANAIAFFLPTSNGESERIECVNPIQVEPAKMGEINKIIQDIKNKECLLQFNSNIRRSLQLRFVNTKGFRNVYP